MLIKNTKNKLYTYFIYYNNILKQYNNLYLIN